MNAFLKESVEALAAFGATDLDLAVCAIRVTSQADHILLVTVIGKSVEIRSTFRVAHVIKVILAAANAVRRAGQTLGGITTQTEGWITFLAEAW